MVIRVLDVRLLAVLGIATVAAPASASDWDWTVAPYGWAASVSSDLHAGSPPIEGSSEMSFPDIFDKLDGAFQVHAEGRGDRVGVFADFTYLGLSDSRTGNFAKTEADLDTRLFEAAWVWIPGGQRDRGFDVFAGVRWIDADLKVGIDPENPQLPGRVLDVGDSYLDAMLGARYTWAPSDRWRVTARGDISEGQTEGTWNASLMAHYRIWNGAILLGYRHLDVQLESAGVRTDLVISGPVVGYVFAF